MNDPTASRVLRGSNPFAAGGGELTHKRLKALICSKKGNYMKPAIFLLLFIILSFQATLQNHSSADSRQQDKFRNSPLFGDNIIIHNVPGQDQNNIAICSAFNGWLYATYWYSNNTVPYLVLVKSTDHGKTWVKLYDDMNALQNTIITILNITACGLDTSDLKVFIGGCSKYTPTGNSGGFIGRFNGNNGVLEDGIFNGGWPVWDLSIAGDNLYPATNSNPFSMAVVYSRQLGNTDSVIVYTSDNGGLYLNRHYNIAASGNYIGKVSISYGRSPAYPGGRYFVCWEEKQNAGSPCGHIYTSHSEPYFNSPFTAPVQLDNLDPTIINKLNNPSISCQANAADNDQANLSELIVCEKYNAANHQSGIVGFVNKTAITSSSYQLFSIDTGTNNNIQPDINFNSFDSTFLLTYFDSTNTRLPFLTNNFNLLNPSSWDLVSDKYNADNNLSAPSPRVTLDYDQRSAAFAWLADQTGGYKAGMFDAQFNFPVGIEEKGNSQELFISRIYPNPASTSVEIEFCLKEKEYVTTSVINTLGQCVDVSVNQLYPKGLNKMKLDISNYLPGIYLLKVRAGRYFQVKKIQIFK